MQRIFKAENWYAGWLALDQGDRTEARRIWSDLAASGEASADTLLGLHSLNSENDQLLLEIVEKIDQLGDDQKEYSAEIESGYRPGCLTEVALTSPADVYAAAAVVRAVSGDIDAAKALIGELDREDPRQQLAEARLYLEIGAEIDCLRSSARIVDPRFRADRLLMSGAALISIGMLKSGLERIDQAERALIGITNEIGDPAELEINYWRGRGLSLGSGAGEDVETAEQLFNQVYAENPDFRDVARRVDLTDPWHQLVSAFFLPAATAATIPDNQ